MPFSPNARHVRGVAGERSFAGSVAWYRTTVIVPARGRLRDPLRVGQPQGRRCGSTGASSPATPGPTCPSRPACASTGGAHTLVVRADWRDPGGDEGRRLASHVVQLRRHQPPRLDPRARGQRARRRRRSSPTWTAPPRWSTSRSASPTAPARGPSPCAGRSPAPRCASVPSSSAAASAPPCARACASRARICGSPATRRSRALRLEVPGEAVFTARVGLREVRWAGGRLELNGEALKLRGASLQEDAPGRGDALTDADADAIVARLKAIGANATRSQHPLSDALLARLDAAGILVWQGVGPVDAPGAWTSRTPVQQRRALRRVRLNVLQERLHPSVVAWNLANEVAGNGHYGGQPEYVDAAAQLAHRLDPGRPTAVDVWGTHMPDQAGFMYRHVDAVGATNYEGWYDDTLAPPATVQAAIDAWLARLRATFPGKVLIVSEFGAEANRAQRARHPGLARASSRACSPATSAPTSRPRGSTASWSGTSRTSRSRRRSRAAPSAARCRRSTSCAGSTRRACSPTTASPSRRSPRCGGRSRAERAAFRRPSSAWRVRRRAALTAASRGRRVAVAGARRSVRWRCPARSPCALRARSQHLRWRPKGWALLGVI